MSKLLRRLRSLYVVTMILVAAAVLRAENTSATLTHLLKGTHASAVVLDWKTGRILAKSGPEREGSPGSAIKPLLLDYALKHQLVTPATTVYCKRQLHIGARALPCSHPADQATLNAETALAESCNTWFAEMAKRFSPEALDAALEESGIRHLLVRPNNIEQLQLMVLGLGGVTASPLELAQAYRRMLVHNPSDTVLHGLRDSVEYGMANQASVPHQMILGKTGTAAMEGSTHTQGWFAGAMPDRFVIVVYVPNSNGAGAAQLAGRFIAQMESIEQ